MGAPQRQKQSKSENKIIEMAAKQPRNARPASDPEARERQLVSLAVDLAEQQLKDGTASAAVLTHYLKLATKRETLEREILEEQAGFLKAKSSSIKQAGENENLAKEALESMKSYTSGSK